jgi:hypothetical protein
MKSWFFCDLERRYMNDLDRIKKLLEIAWKNDLFNMTSYDFNNFENRMIEAVEKYPMTAFDRYKEALDNSNIKYVEVKGDFEKDLDDSLYVATYGSGDSGTIMVQQFNKDGILIDTYVADECHTLEEFVACIYE